MDHAPSGTVRVTLARRKHPIFVDYYLLFGLLIHVALLGLVDWIGYRHLVTNGLDRSIVALLALNIAIACGLYYLVFLPLQQRFRTRRVVRTVPPPRGPSA